MFGMFGRAKSNTTSVAAESTARIKAEKTVQQLQVRGDAERLRGAKKYTGEIQKVLGLATTIAATAGVGGLLGRGFMQDTVEADRLGKSMQLLGREIGQGFAPYVRAGTTGIMELVKAFRAVDQETKVQIAKWVLMAGAISGVIALLPLVVVGVKAVIAAFTLLLSPIGLVAIALGGLAVWFLSGSSDALSFSDIVGKVAEFIGRVWYGLVAAIQTGYTVIANTLHNTYNIMRNILNWDDITTGLKGYGTEIKGIWAGVDGKAKAFGANSKEWASNLRDKLRDVEARLAGIGGKMQKTFDESKNKGFTIKFDVQLESIQGTFDRLLKAFADPGAESIDEAQLGQLQEANANLQKNAAALQDIKRALPPVR